MPFIVSLVCIVIENKIKYFSPLLHQLCVSSSPPSQHIQLYKGIVCGENLDSATLSNLFATTGLLHLLVVSGSHLLLVASISKRIKINDSIIMFLCLIYSFICLLEPPIVRAYIFIGLNHINQKRHLQWSSWHRHFITIFLCICLFPNWIESLSFQLSILCAFALSLTSRHPNLWVYIVLFPALLLLGNYHPFSVLINVSLGPVLGVLLFPLSALAYFIPNLYIGVDLLWTLLIKILHQISFYLQTQSDYTMTYSPTIFWSYILVLWILGKNNFYANRNFITTIKP